jgi:uncharacterized protein
MRRLRGLGIGVRHAFWDYLVDGLLPVEYVELTAEHFFDELDREASEESFGILRGYTNAVHSLAMSLGSPEPLDSSYLSRVVEVADKVQAKYISDHLAFTHSAGIDLGHLNPVPLNQKIFKRIAAKVDRVQQLSGRRFLLENITSHLSLGNEIPEPSFLSAMADETGSGILLDLTNLFVNSKNHRFSANDYLTQLDMGAVCQIHLIGYSERDGQLQDDHASAIQAELLDLLQAVLARNPHIPVVVEWDRNFPSLAVLNSNFSRIMETIDGCGERPREAAGL